MKKKEKNRNLSHGETRAYKFFYVIAVLLVMYMAYSMFNTYVQLAAYCEQYNTTISEQWSYCLQAFLAAIVPCLIYSCTSYGIGIIIKNQQILLEER